MQEIFQVPEKLKAMLDLLDEQREELAKVAKADREINAGEKHKFVDSKLNTAMRDISNAYATLGREYRNWLGHVKTSMDSMSIGRKMQVMIQFFEDLPLGNRRELLDVIKGLEAKRPDGLSITHTDKFAQPAPVSDGDD